MTDQIREQVSALLDGELPNDEIGLLMRRLDRDAELRRAFGSYALIGEVLRAPGGRVAGRSFAERVSEAIDGPVAAPVPGTAEAGDTARAVGSHVAFWKRPVVRTALAASAAATAVFLFRPEPAATVASVPEWSMDSFAVSPTPAQSQRLASYMVAHSQFSTPMVRRSVLSGLISDDPGLTRVSYQVGEAP